MVFKGEISAETRAYVRYLKRPNSLTVREICARTKVSRATVYRCVTNAGKLEKPKRKVGRQKLISARTERLMERKLKYLRLKEGTFNSKRLLEEVGIDPSKISASTVTRTLTRMGYNYVQSRKKGILTEKDRRDITRFARYMKSNFPMDIWTHDICFYLDGVSFVHKYNPWDQARAPKGRVWRRKSEGLEPGCTSKGAHVGTGGRLVKLFVAISFQQGIVCCEQYEKLNGDYFKDFVLQHFPKLFNNCRKSHSRWFIQDGDPSQNSLKARKAMELVGAKLLAIPPRSPDLNPIENVFHLIKKLVDRDALDKHITFESFEEFSKRVKSTFNYMSKDVIDNIIGSMCTRIDMVLKNKGRRTRF